MDTTRYEYHVFAILGSAASAALFLFLFWMLDRPDANLAKLLDRPTVMGTVTNIHTSRDDPKDDELGPRVCYRKIDFTYEINGVTYSKEEDRFGRCSTFTSPLRFTIGGPVRVYYDPGNPGNSVVDLYENRGILPSMFGTIIKVIVGLLAVLTGILSVVWLGLSLSFGQHWCDRRV